MTQASESMAFKWARRSENHLHRAAIFRETGSYRISNPLNGMDIFVFKDGSMGGPYLFGMEGDMIGYTTILPSQIAALVWQAKAGLSRLNNSVFRFFLKKKLVAAEAFVKELEALAEQHKEN